MLQRVSRPLGQPENELSAATYSRAFFADDVVAVHREIVEKSAAPRGLEVSVLLAHDRSARLHGRGRCRTQFSYFPIFLFSAAFDISSSIFFAESG